MTPDPAIPTPCPRRGLFAPSGRWTGHGFYSPSAGQALQKVLICTARRRGVSFAPAKETKTGSRGTDSPLTNPFRSPCCAGYERRFSAKKPSVLHADGLNKVSQMHLPPPNLPRFGGGERPPFLCKPPAPLTITMGQRLTVFASPNTPRVLLSVYSCQPIRAPFPPSGKGVGGKGRCAAATLGAILCAVRIDFGSAANQSVSSTASDRGLGAEPQAYFAYFCTNKSRPPPGRRTNQAF